MTLFHAATEVSGKAAALGLGEALEALKPPPSSIGLHDRDDGSGLWEVGAYLRGRPDPARLALIALIHGAPDFAVAKVGTRDWLAQVRAGLTPVEAGRFVVYGSHDRARVGAHRVGLEIEAALAFGTGHHATTRGCLLALDWLARSGRTARRVADIGTGTGVLAMAALKLWPGRAVAGDIDAVAAATARANAAANRVGPRVSVLAVPGFRHPRLHGRAPYDLILANILAVPLKRLAPGLAIHAAPGGIAVLSGILARQAAGVEAIYRGWGFARLRLLRTGEWTTLVLVRRVRKAKPPRIGAVGLRRAG